MFYNTTTNYNIRGLCVMRSDGDQTVIVYPLIETGYFNLIFYSPIFLLIFNNQINLYKSFIIVMV
jgi:hypothetical protein